MNSQKGIIHVGLILVLLVFGIGALGYVMYKTNSLPVVTTSSPTPLSTQKADYRTYTTGSDSTQWPQFSDKKFFFVFKYPPDLRHINTKERDSVNIEVVDNEIKLTAFDDWSINFKLVKNTTLNEQVDHIINSQPKDEAEDLGEQIINQDKFNEYSIRQIRYPSDQADIVAILIQNGKDVIQIETKEGQSYTKSILSTFRITATLDTYDSTHMKYIGYPDFANPWYKSYSFIYPKSWKLETLEKLLTYNASTGDQVYILFNADGHGLPDVKQIADEKRSYPAGELSYSLWEYTDNNEIGGIFRFVENTWAIELGSLAPESKDEVLKNIDTLLNSVKFNK